MEENMLQPFLWQFPPSDDGGAEETVPCWNGVAGEFMSGGLVKVGDGGGGGGFDRLRENLLGLDIEQDICVSLQIGVQHFSAPGLFIVQHRYEGPGIGKEKPMCVTTKYHRAVDGEYIIIDHCGKGYNNLIRDSVLKLQKTEYAQDHHKWQRGSGLDSAQGLGNGFIRMGMATMEGSSKCIYAPPLEENWQYTWLQDCPQIDQPTAGFEFDYNEKYRRLTVRGTSPQVCLMTTKGSTNSWDYVFADLCEGGGHYGGGETYFSFSYQQPFVVNIWHLKKQDGYRAPKKAQFKMRVDPGTMEGVVLEPSARTPEDPKPTCEAKLKGQGYCNANEHHAETEEGVIARGDGRERAATDECCDNPDCKGFSLDERFGASFVLLNKLNAKTGGYFNLVQCFEILRPEEPDEKDESDDAPSASLDGKRAVAAKGAGRGGTAHGSATEDEDESHILASSFSPA
eukprot:TRINITY_DN40246_c0_g1_i3.p1 TRINITY_DN40246_c0_g1~~TRINITY_DN40246_c0_g1_i3.p1  ORF type:complete len:455 (+),score=65.07 TRINITY_DN40246_c0_g1_i3:319-1683(+)